MLAGLGARSKEPIPPVPMSTPKNAETSPTEPGCPAGCKIEDGWLTTPTGTYSLDTVQGVSVRTSSKPPMLIKIPIILTGLWLLQTVIASSIGFWQPAMLCVMAFGFGFYWICHKHNEVLLHTTNGEVAAADFQGVDEFGFGTTKSSQEASCLYDVIEKHLQKAR